MRHVLRPAELADVELRLLGLLAGPAGVDLAAGDPGDRIELEDRGGTPVATLTVGRVLGGARRQVIGTLEPGRPFEEGVARDRRVTGPLAGPGTVAAFSAPPSPQDRAGLAELPGPVRPVAVATSATDDREVWHLLESLDVLGLGPAALVVLPVGADGEDPALRAEVLAALAGSAALVDVTGPVTPGATGDGCVVLLTGLSGSGKSTLARALADHLQRADPRLVTLLDGDEVRRHLSAGLGFSAADRRTNLLRIAWVAALCARHGGVAICAPIAPYAAVRAEMRDLIEPAGRLVLVHVSTPLEVCEARDRKGLYAKARAGEITGFTGIDDPYEAPQDADLVIDTSTVPVADAVALLAAAVRGRTGQNG